MVEENNRRRILEQRKTQQNKSTQIETKEAQRLCWVERGKTSGNITGSAWTKTGANAWFCLQKKWNVLKFWSSVRFPIFFYANMVVYGVLLLLKHAEKLSCPEYGRVVLQNTRHVFMMGQLCIMVSRTSTKRTSSIDHKNTNEGILQGLGWKLPTAHNDKILRKTSTVSMITAILRPFVPMTIANTSPCFPPERRQQQHQQIE